MDPISALMVAALLTWGTAGGGIKDTAAILKGQTPPSSARRAAKAQQAQREQAMLSRALAEGAPVPAALEARRIRLKDLVRHWWEDALEDADHWRAGRRYTRPERKARRRAWRRRRAEQVAEGYRLLEERGHRRFEAADQDQEQEVPDSQAGPGGAGGQEVPDNVVPLPLPEDHTPGQEAPRPDPDPDPVPEQKPQMEDAVIDLSDAPTLDAHQRALEAYATYMDRIAADMDAMAAGMAQHRMGHIALNAVQAAGTANAEAAADVRQRREELVTAHTRVADARQAAPDAADGEYLTRGK